MYFHLFCLLLISISLTAQDRVYGKKNHVDEWKITEIAKGYIKGADIKNPDVSYSVSHPHVLFIFNGKGSFLVIPRLYDNEIKSDFYVKNFLQGTNNFFLKADQIVRGDNHLIMCKIESEDEEAVVYMLGNKRYTVPKKEIVAIIFRDGSHKLLASIDKTYKVLRTLQDKYYELAFSRLNPGSQDTDQVKSIPVSQPGGQTGTIAPASSIELEKAQATAAGTASLAERHADRLESDKELSPATLIALREKAIINIKELESYIQVISDKQTDPDQVSKAIEQALTLFASEDSRVEVSSRNRTEAQQYKVRVYLSRLGLMKYKKVIIEWYNVQYASKVRKNPDGTYTGLIEFEQRFTGVLGDKKTYQDITRKTIEIVLKSYLKKSAGQTTVAWDVFLGNIGINVIGPE